MTFVPRNTTVGPGSSSSGGASSSSSGGTSSSSSSGGTSSSSGDGGSTSGGTDAGKDAGPPNAFTTKPTFTAGTALQSSTQDNHNAQFGNTNPTDRNCMDCHKNGGMAPEMSIGGGAITLNGTATAGIEVRVVNAKTGAEVADAFTDENGNFYVNSTALTGNFAVGIRNGTKTSLMVGTIPNGACNQGGTCHGNGGAQGSIKLQ